MPTTPAGPTSHTFECDLAVLGATPAGIYAAVTAARLGRRAVLCAYGPHIGGLLSSGLSIANIRYLQAHAGPFDEFARAVVRAYVERHGPDSPVVRETRGGTWWEPHVAEAVFEQLVAAEPLVTLVRNVRLEHAHVEDGRVTGYTVRERHSGRAITVRAPVSVDATYEADLAFAAGVPCRVGREGREEFWEPHAGEIRFHVRTQSVFPGSTGRADGRIQAYCFRLAVTQRPELRVPFPRPDTYDPRDYQYVAEALAGGRVRRIQDVVMLGPGRLRVNGKADVIANVVGAADAYPEADETARAAIVRHHRDHTLGLFWYLQHEPTIPDALRDEARSWGLAADEFADNDHFPYEVYVREARRIRGRATATEHDFLLAPDAERSPLHEDAIAIADYYIDSHATARLSEPPYEEGHVNVSAAQPGQIPYGTMLPQSIRGLLVPVAVSSTHLGFAVIRMEPVWMALGAAAAVAAHLAATAGLSPDALPVPHLQAELARRGHRLAFFHDVPLDAHHPGLQFFATKGFFPTFHARPDDAVTRLEAARWIARFLDLVGPSPAPVAPTDGAPDFADVPPERPHHAVLRRLRALGIVDGWLDSPAFCPAASLRRIDAQRWLARVSGFASPALPGDHPYAPLRRAELCGHLFEALQHAGALPRAAAP